MYNQTNKTNMIENELRIGNYVIDVDNSIIKISCGTAIDGVWEPINLTKEWLLKFGFDNKDYKQGYIGIMCESTDFVLTEPYTLGKWQEFYIWSFDNYKFVSIKHVHQLQNLFYFISKEELNIKQNKQTI